MNSKLKGQILVFEQVLIFGIAIAIFAASFALFVMYQNYYTSSSSRDQITGVKEYVLSGIVKICENDEMNSSVILAIPKTIGNRFYKISLSPVGLNITNDAGIIDFSPLRGYNETFGFSGMVVSDLGKVVIYKIGKSVFIRPQ